MVIFTRDSGKTTSNKEVENLLSKLDNNMKANSIKEWNMDMEFIDGLQATLMLEIL